MRIRSGADRAYLATVVACLLVISCGISHADTWGRVIWQDDFQDTNYTSNPAWQTFGGPGGFTQSVVDSGSGDYVFRLTADYFGTPVDAGWAGAYVNVLEGNQGISGWVDTSAVTSDQWTALTMLRYTPSAIGGFGTGYTMSVTNSATFGMVAQLHQLTDTGYSAITDPIVVSPGYTDLQFRFMATGSGSDVSVRGRLWADGQPEPGDWYLNSDRPGATAGLTALYNTGFGGVGVITTESGVTADASFDNIRYGTPEPTTMALLVTGIGALVLRRRRTA